MAEATKIQSYHVGIAAEGFAAGFLAHAGYEVLVQYGANQPEYDLVARKEKRTLSVSVKGTQENGWGLTHSYLNEANYFQAINDWLADQKAVDIFMFVSIHKVAVGQLPNVWVARPREVAEHLKQCRGGKETLQCLLIAEFMFVVLPRASVIKFPTAGGYPRSD
jgi:Holliday junction resolvase-like predicted endonuclease